MSIASRLAPWRFAARLARREVLRHPWRSVLVVLLVAVPISGMTVLSVVTRSANNADTWMGVYDARTDLFVSSSVGSEPSIERFLPDGTTTDEVHSGWAAFETANETVDGVEFFDRVGFRADALPVSEGHAPRPGEVWLSVDLADRFGVEVGDTLTLRHPAGEWNVAGIGRTDGGLTERVLVMPDLPIEQFRPEILQLTTLVDFPDGTTPRQIETIGEAIRSSLQAGPDTDFAGWANWDESDHRDDEIAPLAWTWVVGTLALAATGIIVAAAFATSARRQLVTLGVLSSNGSPQRSTRRMLALQGAWTGLAGSVLGVAAGVLVLYAFRSFFEHREGRALGDYQFGALYLLGIVATGVVAATGAAMVPARTASKVPVMAALAGRRPLGAVPPRLVSRGLAFSGIGGLLLVMGAVSRDGGVVPTVAATIGGLFVMIGMCFCSPLAVDWMSRASARLSGSWRLAGRSLGRARTRSAAVVTAVAVIGALTVAGAASAHVVADNNTTARMLPRDALALTPMRGDPRMTADEIDLAPVSDNPLDSETMAEIDAIVPSAEWHERRVATWDPAPFDIAADGTWTSRGADIEFVVADDAMMDLYELTGAEREALQEAGVLAVSPQYVGPSFGTVPASYPLTIVTEDGEVELDYARRQFLEPDGSVEDQRNIVMYGLDPFLITENAARDAGFDIVTRGGFLRSDSTLTNEQRNAVQNAIYGYRPVDLGQYYRDVPAVKPDNAEWSVYVEWGGRGMTTRSMQGILVGIAFALTLLVVAIGLALAAAEGVTERDVLVAVGGRPGTMRSMAGARATVLTFTGVALAVPFGLLPIYAVMRATDHRFEMPWLVIGALLVVVPVLAGGAAWLVSAIAQRIRPVRISNLAFD